MSDPLPCSAAHAAALLAGQNRILRMVAAGEPLLHVLDELIRFMEAESGEALCSVLLLDEGGTRLCKGAAPSLPEAYNDAVDNIVYGPMTGSCGAAVYRRETVIVTDIEHDPLWAPYKDIALVHGLRACMSSPILDSRGEPLGTFAFYYRTVRSPSEYDHELIQVSRDLSGIAIERSRTFTRLGEAIRARDNFLTIASHELQTPIMTLLLQARAVRMFERQGPDASVPLRELVPKLSRLERQAQRLSGLVERMLDVSRLVSGTLGGGREPMDLADAARAAVARQSEAFLREKTELSLRAEGPVMVLGDRSGLEEVLDNLLSNALKFGEGRPVVVSVERQAARARVSVRDRGIGIAPSDLPRIFGKFERAVSVDHYGGLGLGLWLSRELCERMGGRLEVESALGEGSTFTVELPAAA